MNIPETLLYRILKKKCILFLGAGATLESGGLLGADLAKYLYDQLGDTGVELNTDLPRFTYNLVKKGFRSEIEECIRDRLKYLIPSQRFKKVAAIPWKAIYTTNYDDLIEKSYREQRYYEYTLENPLTPPQKTNDPSIPLYKINGDINTPYSEEAPLIVTLEDLKLAKKTGQAYIDRIMEDLNDTFVFIGYSFSDKIILDILESFSNNSRWEFIKEKYIVLPEISEDLKTDLEIYKIKYIKGTADDFFEEVNKETEASYKNKLQQLKILFPKESPLSSFEPRTMNYICECFEFYNSSANYPVDPTFFYRGGKPNFGIIRQNYDVFREMDVADSNEKKIDKLNTETLVDFVFNLSCGSEIKKLLIKGASVSGKTSLIYRLAYELTERGVLTFLFRSQSEYKSGLLYHMYEKIQSPFVIIFDDLIIDYEQMFEMITDVQKNKIPAIFIATSRYSDWENIFSNYNKTRLKPLDYHIDIKDNLDKDEAKKLVKKMVDGKILHITTKYEEDAYTKKIANSHNLISILLEIIDSSSSITNSICNEYDNLSVEAKLAYGIVSLSYRYGMKLPWGLLKRAIEERYSFTWEDFIDKILKGDAKGNLFEEEIQGEQYISGRHRFISELIIQIHYKGNYSEEITDLECLIKASTGSNSEEYFVGTLINAILQNKPDYTLDQIERLLDFTIDTFVLEKNKAFINHLKGELLLSKRNYDDAIKCFDANVQNDLNKMYSLHSMGKAYFYLAKTENTQSGNFRNHINYAKKKLFEGIELYPKNEYYYSMLLLIFDFLQDNGCFSERDEADMIDLESLVKKNLNITNLSALNKTDEKIV